MYNPYNWKIMKKSDERILPDNHSKHVCIFDELAYICFKLDGVRLKQNMLNNELSAVNDEIINLERKKISLIEELAKHP